MDHRYKSRQTEPPGIYTAQSTRNSLLEWLYNPTVLIVASAIVFTSFYQSLHSSPFNRHRHPGELLWDFIVTITPAALLYAIDDLLNPPMFPVSKSLRPRTFTAKSELLRKLLGMDQPGGGIIGSVTSAGRKSLSTLSSSTLLKRDCNQPAGLGNTDYSCFQNSILQSLASLQPLPEYLESATVDHYGAEGPSKEGSGSTLQQLIKQLKDHENNGKTLWTPAKLKSLHSWEQQDAQEYFSKLLDEIEKEVVKASKAQSKSPGLEAALSKDDTESHYSDDSGYQTNSISSKASSDTKVVRNPLEGMTAQRVACVQCGYSEGLSLQPFNCITLNLGIGTMQHDLYELLDSYTQLESIEQVECNKCTLIKAKDVLSMLLNLSSDRAKADRSRLDAVELALEEEDFEEKTLKEKCKISPQLRSSSTKTKQVVVARPPRSLAIHVNRSVFDFNTGNMFKNLAAVKFPKTLDLGPWCLGSADQSAAFRKESLVDAEKDDLAREQETWVLDPQSSMISGDHYSSKISGPIYELRAVVTHQGQHENGHYICFRKHSMLSAEKHKSSSLDLSEDETRSPDDDRTLVEESLDGEEHEDRWWRLSDEHVWDVPEKDVLGQGGVFMLFYDCVDPNSVLASSAASEKEEIKEPAVVEEARDIPQGAHISTTERASVEALESGEAVKDSNPYSASQEAAADPTAVQEANTMNEKGTTQEPRPAVPEAREDNFVSSLLSRPNSLFNTHSMADLHSAISKPQRVAVSKNQPPSTERLWPGPVCAKAVPRDALPRNTKDLFVSSLLSRPNY
ncbi:putative USP domain-containing protein [Seiridium unicorne]|uniref:ubiquitinyl hydrolase 1 n=1 Tax=Seiridium unicorne TaxID=138068 RepID=A0ABR2V5S0_9PEZI